jgi:hypothetical protein
MRISRRLLAGGLFVVVGWFGVGEVYLDSEGHLRSAGYPSGVSDPVLHYVQ